jgi:3-oxoacyl-[acyl-carrier-protein] synthase-3
VLGIERIATYLPETRRSNAALAGQFGVDEAFLRQKIGVLERRERAEGQETSDLALAALEDLLARSKVPRESIDALIVVTQTPDHCLPHVSAIVHGKGQLSNHCAAFDVSLGCSGYVYGISILQAFLAANGGLRGVLITADPYSKVVDPADKNTALLFGDAATATLIGPEPVFSAGPFRFGTHGAMYEALICRDGVLHMNGREIFNFTATAIPGEVDKLLAAAALTKENVDCFLFHQGSKYIVETIARRAHIPLEKVRIGIEETGNTVSSSIPLLLQRELDEGSNSVILLSGFGVGLSWGSCILKRVRHGNGQS